MKHRIRRAVAAAMLLTLCLVMGCAQNSDGSYSITVNSIMDAIQGNSGQADGGVFQTGKYVVPELRGGATLRKINDNTYSFVVELSDGNHATSWGSDQCRPKGSTLTCPAEGLDFETGDVFATHLTIEQVSPGKLTINAPRGVASYLCGGGLCFIGPEYIKN